MKQTKMLVQGAIIAGLYVALTLAFAPISFLQVQVRISEVLTILPVFTPAAIPGLFVGVLIANMFGGLGIIDIVLGSLATLTAAYLSRKMPRRWLVPLPPVVINAVVVAFILNYVLGFPYVATMGWVAIGQIIACYGLGYPFMLVLDKYKDNIFK
ncbi:protein of unknown function DUF988 [Alkaliphilus metalliredigens QYMF]|uniref:QueT transporter n=1 Tax=Alkaliphilus metalliredigens (strain QYMF) TaxID=293826 RepID=A6TJ88_ALKMQ|nr:QueT transporter family protein [Alkaliphilus metalliredigens]ABR46256.1 protein of unknown function DUF988 [Alkaliphilus metalliredigens QYMF]